MEDNSLLMIILAFVLGCMCSQMMKSMCGGRLVEGLKFNALGDDCDSFWYSNLTCGWHGKDNDPNFPSTYCN